MASSSQSQHRCVFVGNIPYDATEEQLIQICEEVGPVVSFRLVIDRETGKPKGYGFCEYKDEETALSARRNLQGYEINGRQLRVDFAENDKNADRNREQGRGGLGIPSNVGLQKQVGGPAVLGDPGVHQPIGDSIAMAAATLMAGALGAPQIASMANQIGFQGQSLLGTDPLTHHLAKMSKSQLTQIISEIKGMASQNKEQARQLLLAMPNLSKALFQAQIMLGMVSHQMLQVPGIRQSPAQPVQHLVPSGQTLPGLPPLPQPKMLSSLLPYPQESQLSSGISSQYAAVPQVPIQSQFQHQQPLQNQVLLQKQLPVQSGISPLASVLPQSLGGPSSGPHIHVPTSSSLNQQLPGTLLQNIGKVPMPVSGYTAQPMAQNGGSRPFALIHPHFPDEGFQPRSSTSSDLPDKLDPKFHGLTLPGKTGVIGDGVDQMNRASKMVKINDGRAIPFSPAVNLSGPTSLPALTSDSSARQTPTAEESRPPSEKQVTKMELPSDVDSTLLQQVLSLTPEQLSSLPPEQQQQVIQLQQMLRQVS